MLARSALCPARAFASRHPPAILGASSSPALAAPFSTSTRASGSALSLARQSQPRFFTPQQRFAPAKGFSRNASTAPSAASPNAPAAKALTWNDFFALRRTRRRIGQACSVVAAVGVHELCGFGLHALDPRPRLFTNGFTTAGVIVATVAAGAAVGNLAWLLTASRRRAAGTARDGGTGDRNGTGPDGTEREAEPAAVRGVPSAVGAVASSAAAED